MLTFSCFVFNMVRQTHVKNGDECVKQSNNDPSI